MKCSTTLLVLWLSIQTVIFLLAELSEEYFSCHSSLSFILQHVGVIFNHNKWRCLSLCPAKNLGRRVGTVQSDYNLGDLKATSKPQSCHSSSDASGSCRAESRGGEVYSRTISKKSSEHPGKYGKRWVPDGKKINGQMFSGTWSQFSGHQRARKFQIQQQPRSRSTACMSDKGQGSLNPIQRHERV